MTRSSRSGTGCRALPWVFGMLLGWLPAHGALAQQIRPWTETVVSVQDIPATARLFVEVGGWRRTHHGTVDRRELDYWRLPAAATAEFARDCAPGVDTGCLRLVRFAGVAQRPVRLATRAWDTGGIFSVMVRSDDVGALFTDAIARGWWAESEPVEFTWGSSVLRNVVLTGPHGIHLAAYERVAPPFTAFPVGRISQAFNSMRMVRSRPVARDFYTKVLGFEVVFDGAREAPAPTRSNFGIPFNLTPEVKRAAAALQPVPGETGRVEMMQLEGFRGTDVSMHASPPNLGILTVRYPVDDLAALRRRLAAHGIEPVYAAAAVAVPPLGQVDLLAIRDPDGNLTEFYAATVPEASP